MSPNPKVAFSHVGLFVTDLQKMVDFYVRILGLVVSDRETTAEGVQIAFLTGDPREHHQVVLASGRPTELNFNLIQQLSFRVDGLATLRSLYDALLKEPVTNLGPVSHGNAISCYFRDPEGNRLELFVDTPWHVPQPFRVPLELGRQSDDDLWSWVEAHARKQPGFVMRSEWRDGIAARLQDAPPKA
jgi:catechol 2,3-dioxygenase-like lactoylglutathione lyase family enzyme